MATLELCVGCGFPLHYEDKDEYIFTPEGVYCDRVLCPGPERD